MKLYNTLTRKKEEFKPIKPKEVGMYCCGPTVYNYAHLGNLRSFVFEDILKRALVYNNYKVNHIMNITDVGHLTSDADEGEDKMLKGAKREKKTVWQIADFYTKAFFEDIKKLNILKPDKTPKATEHIQEMINIIKILEKKGYTYQSGGNIYFNTKKFKNYSKLARLKLTNQKERVNKDKNKKNPTDFVLWFTKSKFQNQEMKWDSPWGKGYPGWHIECSAMSSKYLGKQFDIHCGGIDHIPVHHTNEIAQSECAFDKKPWVKYWLHNEFLLINNGKMSKSINNFLTLKSLEDKNIPPLALRYFFFTAHYRKKLNLTEKSIQSAKNSLEKLQHQVNLLKESKEIKTNPKLVKKYKESFINAINDDLNIPKALALTWDLLKDNQLSAKDKYNLLKDFDKVFGLNLNKTKESIPEEIKKLISQREKARKNKDFKKADEIRNKIQDKGYLIEDSKQGARVRKK